MENQDRIKVAIIATLVVGVIAAVVVQANRTHKPPPPRTPREPRETPTELNAPPVNTEAPKARVPRKKKVTASQSGTNEATTTYPIESHATQSHADNVASNLATAQPNPVAPSTA